MAVFLPEELMYEILIRIPPTKDLLKFKIVCKRWQFLISHPKFASDNLRYSKQEHQIIFSSARTIFSKYYYSIHMQENVITPKEIRLPRHTLDIRDSCNGMLLLQNLDENLDEGYKMFTIYNPVTHVNKVLPTAPKICSSWTLVHDASTKKYKVFGITLTLFGITLTSDFFVFTQGETNWKHIHTLGLPACTYLSSELICLENKLYWTGCFREEDWSAYYIYSIDVADEEQITRTDIPFKVKYEHCLSEVSGSLYITNYLGNRLETWVLKDIANNLWTKCCSIVYGSAVLPGNSKVLNFVAPRYIKDSTTFLDQSRCLILNSIGNLSMYDLKGKELRKSALFRINSLGKGFTFHINSLLNWE